MQLVPLTQDQRRHFDWLSRPELVAVTDALSAACTEEIAAMYVGGSVRDSLRGHPPFAGDEKTTDIDVATPLTPEEASTALVAAGIKVVPTGIDHGTVTAVSAGLPVEITTLRADVVTDGRHADVAYTTDWNEDWRRRDFTINAIYATPDGRLFDPANGQAALAAQEVAFIGDANTRLEEDYLRLLRFYRFAARYDAYPFGRVPRAACAAAIAGLSQISRERIGQEMRRLLTGPAVGEALTAMAEDGVLQAVFDAPADVEAVKILVRLADGLMRPSAPLMLAALWPGADASLATALRLSNAEAARRQGALAAKAYFQQVPAEPEALVMYYRLKKEAYTDGLILGWAEAFKVAQYSPAQERRWQQALSLPGRWELPVFPVTGDDLMKAGLSPGPQLGKALQAVEESWIAAGFPEDTAIIDQFVAEAVSSLAL